MCALRQRRLEYYGQRLPVLICWCKHDAARICSFLVMDNHTMELDFVKQVEVAKDLASALAYLHAQ
eukprot:scaffold299962_cov24-Tisochrysis_lutea.AAC.1